MHKDQKEQVKGVGEQIKGKIKEEVGDLTDNKSMEIKGKVEKNVGKAREEMGSAAEQERLDRSGNR